MADVMIFKRRSGSPSSLFTLREREIRHTDTYMHDSMAFDPIASVHCMQQYMVEYHEKKKFEKVIYV